MPTQRNFTPIGSYPNKKAAEAAAETMSKDTGKRWIPCRGGRVRRNFAGKPSIDEGYAIVRKDAA